MADGFCDPLYIFLLKVAVMLRQNQALDYASFLSSNALRMSKLMLEGLIFATLKNAT